MNDPLFTPAYETRRLLVIDRSGVSTPIDRGRVLLNVELPATSP
jgi:hypothetical protein